MEPFIFGIRNNIHILDLSQTIPMLHNALSAVRDVTKSGGRILFVGTKRQGQEIIANAANDCAQYYMNHRWYGGTLTNWKTISNTIKRLRNIEELLENEDLSGLTKKELLKLNREKEKLDISIGGIKDMGGLPDLIFVLDTVKEQIAIEEATKLNIPIAAIIDSNSNPDGITFPIPGNDDSTKAISLFCDLISKAALDGIAKSQSDNKIENESNTKVTKKKSQKGKGEDIEVKDLTDKKEEIDKNKTSDLLAGDEKPEGSSDQESSEEKKEISVKDDSIVKDNKKKDDSSTEETPKKSEEKKK